MRAVLWGALWFGVGAAGLLGPEASASTVSPETVLAAVDRNLTSDSRTMTVTATVEADKRAREFQIVLMARGSDAAAEHLAPARDKGTRVQRRGADLWVWTPSAGRAQKLSADDARHGVLGSDVSYEDLLGAPGLAGAYTASGLREETLDGQPAWVIELAARAADATYPRRVVWVDPTDHVLLKQELFAGNGMLLKTWTQSVVKDIGGRKVPTRLVVEDQVKKGSRTTLVLTGVTFGGAVDPAVFAPAWLDVAR